MSFSIWASGVANGKPFHYYREDCIDGDDFIIANLINDLQNMSPSSIGLAQAAVEKVIPNFYSGGDSYAMGTLVFLELLGVLKNQIDSLAMCDNAANGRISVFTKQKHTFWADDLGNGTYYFSPGNDPGTEFVKAIGACLEKTDMNNWGVLRAMIIVLTLYSDAVGQSGKPMLTIQLEK
ncbi:MAG TPA: hypothetical protein PKY82_10820 [Pyrinomonadaceae bacterium]|nr:hypothetical protein [Pyrinomonadaceae bacterium]